MSYHGFDPEVAKEVGVNAAIIYKNIQFWCEKNRANRKHVHDGKAWTYNSVQAWSELFPYLTKDQIRRALERLEEAEYISSGSFNNSVFDRTKWYCDLHQVELASMPNETGVSAKCHTDSKPYITPLTPQGGKSKNGFERKRKRDRSEPITHETVRLDRIPDEKLWKKCEQLQGKLVPSNLINWSFPKAIVVQAMAALKSVQQITDERISA